MNRSSTRATCRSASGVSTPSGASSASAATVPFHQVAEAGPAHLGVKAAPGSRETLERITGAPVTSFCYPYGDFDDRAVEAVRAAGYRAATVIRGGISKDLSDPFRLKRVAVRGTNTRLDFRLALTRGRSRL